MLSKLKLKGRILLGYSFPLLLLLVINCLAFLNSKSLDAAFKKVTDAKTASQASAEAVLGMSKVERATQDLLLLGKNENSIVESFDTGVFSLNKSLATAEKFVNKPQEKQRLTELRKLGEQLEEFDREIISLIQKGNRDQAITRFETLKGRQFLQEFESLQNEFVLEQDKIVQSSVNEVKQATTLMQVVSGLGTLAALTITVVISYLLSSSIAKTIQEASSALNSHVKDITNTVNEQERIIVQQSTSVNETTTTIQELGVSALQSAEQAENSAGEAKQALTLAEGGTRTVGLTIEGISELRDQVSAIANQIVRLSEQTSQISTVSDIVADLASQTNMLALNAGVEAARAGDQGKGFAVVASEIRKLADQSRKSTNRINALVNEVQAAINSTIMVTDEGTKKATYGIKLVAETGDVFTDIADAVNSVFLNNQQIAQQAKQQAVAVQQVVSAMNVINLGAQETADSITQVKDSTNNLNEAAQNLQAVV